MSETIPFGRHEGKTVRFVVDADINYAFWLLGQPWFRARHHDLHRNLYRTVSRIMAANVECQDAYSRGRMRGTDIMDLIERPLA